MDWQPLKALLHESNRWGSFLLLAVLVSGIAVSYVGHENRRLHNTLQQELDKKNKAQVEWGQLLLQQSTLTAPDRVEKIARNELDMEVPGSDRIQVLAP